MAYTGVEVTIPLGQLGLHTDDAPNTLPPSALIYAKNIVFNRGMVQKAPGTLAYNATALDDSIVAGHDWWPVPELQRMIALTAAGSLYRDTGDRTFSASTAITTGLTQCDARSMFVEGGNETLGNNKKLFLLTFGKNQVKVLSGDGTSFADIATPATDWLSANYPKVGLVHRNRLWLFSGNRAYASNTGNHEDFQTSILTQSIFPGEGGDIIGVYVFKGRMFAFKEGNFVYFLNESDPSSANWYWQKLANNFGLASPNSIVQALDDMLVGNSTGTITSYRAADTLGDVESADIFRGARMEQFHRANSHPKGLPVMHGLYDEERKQVYYTYRSTYSQSNDRIINIDMNLGSPRISFLDKGSPVCLFNRRGKYNIPVPYYGSTDGKIHQMNYEDRLEGVTSYEGRFQTAFTDFKWADPVLGNQRKHFDWITIEYKPEGSHNLTFDYYIDGKIIESGRTVSMEADQVYLDNFVLDTNRLASYTVQSNRVPLSASGKRISFDFYNSGANESFQIASITVGFRTGGQDDTRY